MSSCDSEFLVILDAEADPTAVVSGQTPLDPAPQYFSIHGYQAPEGAQLQDGTAVGNVPFRPVVESVELPAAAAFRPGALSGVPQPGTAVVELEHDSSKDQASLMHLRDLHWYQRRMRILQGPASVDGRPVPWAAFRQIFDGLADAFDLQPETGRLEARHPADVALEQSAQSAGGYFFDGFGAALDFDGRGYLRLTGDGAALETQDQTLQLHLWVDSLPQAAELWNVDGAAAHYLRIKPDGAVRAEFSGVAFESPAGALPLGRWTTVTARRAAVSGGFEVQLFVDAAPLLGSMVVGGTLTVTDTDVLIGVRTPDEIAGAGSDYNRAFHGYLREVRVFDRALSDTEIAENHALPATGDEDGLVALWQLNDVDATNGSGNPATFDAVSARQALIVDEVTWSNPGLGGPELVGQPMPFAVGFVQGIEPQLVDPLTRLYRYHAREAGGVVAAYGGGGVPLTNSATAAEGENPDYTDFPLLGLFQLHNPVQVLRLDLQGDAVGGYVETADECAARLASLADVSVDNGLFDLRQVGHLDREGKPLSESIAYLLGSVRGFRRPDPAVEGGIVLDQVIDPQGAAVARTLYDISDIVLINPTPDTGRPVLHWGRTWSTVTAEQVLGAAEPEVVKRLLREWRTAGPELPAWQVGTAPPAEPYDTAFTTEGGARAEDGLRRWLHDPRAWHLQLSAQTASEPILGEFVALDSVSRARWPWLPSGPLVVLGAQPRNGRWYFELFGGL